MIGREKKESNDLFFLCSLIEYIGRKAKNHRNVIVNALGEKELYNIYNLADVYHSENIDEVSDNLITKYNIKVGIFDNVGDGRYKIPTHWDIGNVYKRLITDISGKLNKGTIDTLIMVYNSWISCKIDDYNSSLYFENPDYLYQSFLKGEVL